jgi:hypothetical protein
MLFFPVLAATHPRRTPFFGFLGKAPTGSGSAHPQNLHAGVYTVCSGLRGVCGRMRVERSAPTKSTPLFSTTYEIPLAQVLSFDIHPSNGGVWGLRAFSTPMSYSLSPIPFLFILLRTLLHSSKTQLVCFQAIPNSLRKTPGWGYPLRSPARDAPSSRVGHPSVPLRREAFGATIWKGTR